MIDFDKLTETEFARLLAAVDKAEGALHVFRASLAEGGAKAANARDNYNREHQLLENYISLLNARQLFGKERIA
ncbi:MAG: hypothetical protein MJ074_06510 [Oscillospiraceae bacterium]|nr:hypothetical protein [Oscillospiraceae bacterium]